MLTFLPDLLSESNESAGEVQESEEGGFEFIVVGGDASELFEFSEEPFDPIAGAVGVGVGGEVGVGPIRTGGELGHDPTSETGAAEVVAVEPFVADEFVNDGGRVCVSGPGPVRVAGRREPGPVTAMAVPLSATGATILVLRPPRLRPRA